METEGGGATGAGCKGLNDGGGGDLGAGRGKERGGFQGEGTRNQKRGTITESTAALRRDGGLDSAGENCCAIIGARAPRGRR